MQIIVFWLIVYLVSRHNISETPIDKYGFKDVYQKIILPYMKINSLSRLPFASQSVYNDVKFNEHTLDNQASFLNQLANVDFDYFSPILLQNRKY